MSVFWTALWDHTQDTQDIGHNGRSRSVLGMPIFSKYADWCPRHSECRPVSDPTCSRRGFVYMAGERVYIMPVVLDARKSATLDCSARESYCHVYTMRRVNARVERQAPSLLRIMHVNEVPTISCSEAPGDREPSCSVSVALRLTWGIFGGNCHLVCRNAPPAAAVLSHLALLPILNLPQEKH